MHDKRTLTEDRLTRVLNERIRPAATQRLTDLNVSVWHVDGGQGEPVQPSEALKATYSPTHVGQPWGPAWGTSWFHLTGEMPQTEPGQRIEAVVDLGWADHSPGFQAEGLVYRSDLSVIKGLNPRNQWIPLQSDEDNARSVDLYIEAAANPLILEVHPFLPTDLGEKTTAGDRPLYRLARAEIVAVEEDVVELVADLDVLDGLMRELAEGDPRRGQILASIERCLDLVDLADVVGTAAVARKELNGVLESPAHPSAHRISAIGHAHIDSAWLWPVRETVRKVARTTANVVNLIDENEDFVFAMSSAQQFAWLEEHHPEIFARVAEKVQQGKIVPVGGMWVESDTNMVGGEAMVRQFLLGKNYFIKTFGIEPEEVWLPDSFGYTAAMPQIVSLAGMRWFLTQKISWSQTNQFPHHTFWWEGIDGTRVFTHFPPIDTYNSDLSGRELAHASRNFNESGAATRSLAPFGYGDGGGGPTREMIARARRTADLEGSPRVSIETPRSFFTAAQNEYTDAPVWTGELYLELHRGTFTSQAKTKQGNRRSEHLLREAELWASTAAVRGLLPYPYEQLDRIWKEVLLNQFHDILPGTSIAWVHRETVETHAQLRQELNAIISDATGALATDAQPTDSGPSLLNASPFPRNGVPALSAAPAVTPAGTVVIDETDGIVLNNDLLRVRIDQNGLITSVHDFSAGREVLPSGQPANLLQLHPDFPAMWDAWDIDEYYRNVVDDLTQIDSLTVNRDANGGTTVCVNRSFGTSHVIQTITLEPDSTQVDLGVELDWHEREKLLKVALPVDVHTAAARYETQFGYVERATHVNTSWEAARFEVPAHRWVQVSEPGYAVGVANDSTYGHDITRHARPGGGTYSTVRLSLLRAPRFPDPLTDQGHQQMRYALLPGADVAATATAGYGLNLPMREVPAPIDPLISVEGPVTVESIKLAEDRSSDVIVRLYEGQGARAAARVHASFEFDAVEETDLLERAVEHDGLVSHAGQEFEVALRPFQLVTVRLRRKA